MSFLLFRAKPKYSFDIIDYEHDYLEPKSFINDLKHRRRFQNIVFVHEPKRSYDSPYFKSPYLVVPQDELLSFVRYFRDKIRIPTKWKSRCKHFIEKWYGADVFEVAVGLPFYPVLTPPSPEPKWVCGFALGRREERLEGGRPKYNYSTRIDIPRQMVQIKNDQYVREILNQFLILDVTNICITYL